MAGLRTRCMDERMIVLVTIWPSLAHKESGGPAIRVATEYVTITDAAGHSYLYTGALPPSFSVTTALSLAPQSATVRVPWLSDSLTPADVDYRDAVGEVAELWTSAGAAGTWESRELRIVGAAVLQGWGNDRELMTFRIEDPPLKDKGQRWPPGAELSASRFPDIASTGTRDRARLSVGVLPPIVYAPIGSGIYAPIYVVVDEEVAGSGGLNTARRYATGWRIPASASGAHQFRLIDPERDGGWMDTSTASEYQGPILTGTDDIGERYYYVTGDFRKTVGSSSITITNGSADVTASKTRGQIAVGDIIKGTTGANADYEEVVSVDGSSVELSTTYGGATVTNGSVHAIRLPAEQIYPGFRVCALGGDSGPDGVTPISTVVDVLRDDLADARLALPIALGDLEGMRGWLDGVDISAVLNSRDCVPWDWAMEKIVSWAPIRPYRDGGRVRFAWTGPVSAADVLTTLDLDDYGPIHRVEDVSWVGAEIIPRVALTYDWTFEVEDYTANIALDGERVYQGGPIDTWLAHGRALRALQEWRSTARLGEVAPLLEVESDVIEVRTSAGLVATWILYGVGHPRQALRVGIGQELFWLAPGDVVRITETGVTRRSQIWRVEMRTVAPSGVGSLVLESVVS